jgi:hypothetical protein
MGTGLLGTRLMSRWQNPQLVKVSSFQTMIRRQSSLTLCALYSGMRRYQANVLSSSTAYRWKATLASISK